MCDLKTEIYESINKELFHIEEALLDNLNSRFDLVSKISSHILFSGGKRIRPLLMVLSAKICGYNGNEEFKYSSMLEYLHAATLLHDDILDKSYIRRNNITANCLWDKSEVLLTGDFLLSRAILLAVETGRCSIVKVLGEVAEKMSQGEVIQLEEKKNFLLSEEKYFKIISYKTAMMFMGSCKIGALLAFANQDKLNALARYGYNLGMAFQLTDDLLDYTGNFTKSTKSLGMDLREGKLTLPVIFSMINASNTVVDEIYRIINKDDLSQSEFIWFVEILKKYGGIDYTYNKATNFVNNAKKSLKIFGNCHYINILNNIANYVIIRTN